MNCAVSFAHDYFFCSLCALAARFLLTIESNALDPYASGFSIAESNASDIAIISNCTSVAIFLPSGKELNFLRSSDSVSADVVLVRASGRAATITTTSP